VETKGVGRPSIHAQTRRVRANLSYLLRNKRIVKDWRQTDGALVAAGLNSGYYPTTLSLGRKSPEAPSPPLQHALRRGGKSGRP
jgi:hypothetical protein